MASRFDFFTTGHSFHRFMDPTNINKMMELGFALGLKPREDGPERWRLANMNAGLFPGARVSLHRGSCAEQGSGAGQGSCAEQGSGVGQGSCAEQDSGLEPAAVLDAACGKGGVSYLLAENFYAQCTGVDASEGEVLQANGRKSLSPRGAMLDFVHDQAIPYVQGAALRGERFDACLCIGATFAFGDFAGTIAALKPLLKPYGSLCIGEVTLNRVEGAEQFAEECRKQDWDLRYDSDYVEIAREHGLELVYLIDSGLDDWDRYEALQWLALYENLRQKPNDEAALSFWKRVRDHQCEYLDKERKYVGWKIFVFRPSIG